MSQKLWESLRISSKPRLPFLLRSKLYNLSSQFHEFMFFSCRLLKIATKTRSKWREVSLTAKPVYWVLRHPNCPTLRRKCQQLTSITAKCSSTAVHWKWYNSWYWIYRINSRNQCQKVKNCNIFVQVINVLGNRQIRTSREISRRSILRSNKLTSVQKWERWEIVKKILVYR